MLSVTEKELKRIANSLEGINKSLAEFVKKMSVSQLKGLDEQIISLKSSASQLIIDHSSLNESVPCDNAKSGCPWFDPETFSCRNKSVINGSYYCPHKAVIKNGDQTV